MRFASIILGSFALLIVATHCKAQQSTSFTSTDGTRKSAKPNIVFILADDQGWNGTSVQMHPRLASSKSDYYQTPNIQKLANTGMRFSQAYAPGPMCSPTRASLQTGKSPAQLKMTNVGGYRPSSASQKLVVPEHTSTLATKETTIGEVLSKAGYATAWYGKWHLGGRQGPGAHGYDAHDGSTGNNDGNTEDPNNPKDIFGITERGITFMEKCAAKGKPFYLQLWHYAVHSPIQAKESTLNAVRSRRSGTTHRMPMYAAMTQDLDTSVGMILDKLRELSLDDNTYVVYMSDHGAGPRSPNTPLQNGKGTLWEGGVRVPLIISGPGIKTGKFCEVATVGWDLFSTFCEWAGVKSSRLPKGIEGTSLTPLLNGNEDKFNRQRDGIALHFPHYKQGGQGRGVSPHSTLVLGNYKLIKFYESNELKLFDLSKDIGEERDLSKKLTAKAQEMEEKLNNYLKSVQAGIPVANPNYNSNAAPETGRRGNKKAGGKGSRGGGMRKGGGKRKKRGGGGRSDSAR